MVDEVEKETDKFLRAYLREWEKRLMAAKARRIQQAKALSAGPSKGEWASKLIKEAPLR